MENKEEWRQAPQPFREYSVSSLGRVKGKTGRIMKRRGLDASPGANASVVLNDSSIGKRRLVIVRELVALTFIEEYGEGKGIRFKDGNRENVAVDNLEVFNLSEESEDRSLPTKAQILTAFNNLMSEHAIAKKYNLAETRIPYLLKQYGLIDYALKRTEHGNSEPLVVIDREEWVELEGKFYGYELSNLGNVRNTKTKKELGKSVKSGLIRVALGNNKSVFLAKEVMKYFIPNPEGYKYYRFIDGDYTNCRADNIIPINRRDFLSSNGRVNKSASYTGEAPLVVQNYIRVVKEKGLTDYIKENGLESMNIDFMLLKFGFPNKRSELIEAYEYHEQNGTLEDYIKGLTNIERVELFDGEIKKPATNFPGYYITNMGRIISHQLFVKEKVRKKASHFKLATAEGCFKTVHVRLLVATEFLPNPHNHKYVLNLDNDLTNNHVDNLKWVSKDEYYKAKSAFVRGSSQANENTLEDPNSVKKTSMEPTLTTQHL